MHAFRPQLLSQSEIQAMLAEISPEESRQAPPQITDSLQAGHAASRRSVVKIKPPLVITEE